jgi:hypothetical protein
VLHPGSGRVRELDSAFTPPWATGNRWPVSWALGCEPAFFPNAMEAPWELAEQRWLYIEELPERAGHALHAVPVGGYLVAWGYSVFCRPLLTLPAGMLDHRVRARKDQARVPIVETHQVWRLAARSADLDDLARPLSLADDTATHVQPVSDGCLHPPTSLTRVPAAPVDRRTSHGARIATTSIHLDAMARPGCVGGRASGN